MRFPIEEKSELVKKLQKQMSNVEELKEGLGKSDKVKSSMFSILTTFELRLTKLEEAIMPIYKETDNLKKRHENIEQTVVMLDRVIGFYHASEEVEPVMRDGPNADLEKYIESLDRLSEANKFLRVNNCESATTDHVMSLFDSGVNSLLKEFYNLLVTYAKTVCVSELVAVVVKEEDSLPKDPTNTSAVTLASPIHHYPDKILQNLKTIALWMSERGGGGSDGVVDGGVVGGGGFVDTFANIRSQYLVRTLQDIQDKLKSTDTREAGVLGGVVQSPMNKYKARSIPRKLAKGRVSALLKPRDSSNNRTSMGAGGVMEEGTEDDSNSLALTIPCLIILLQSEESLLSEIVPLSERMKVYDRLASCGVEFVLKRTEHLSQAVLKTPTKHYSTPALHLLPTLKQLHHHKMTYMQLLKNCQLKTREQYFQIQDVLDDTGCRSLEEYTNVIRNDPDRSTSMPKDGTVHELTSNSVFFMEQLLEHSDVVGRMLMNKDTSVSAASADDKPRVKLAVFYTKVLSNLGLNLNNKANNLPEHQCIRSVFLLNNFNYVLKSLRRSGMMDIIHLWNSEVESFYSSQITNQKRLYSQSWSKVILYISDNQKDVSTLPPLDAKLKDKERNAIKEKFTGFNKEFEEIQRQQKPFAMPDAELRSSLIEDNKAYILPFYSSFLRRYVHCGFTKNAEKYVKYSEAEVARCMDTFFEG